MLYDIDTLTESQARDLIGDKMNARIDFLNDWCKKMDINFYYTQQ